MYTTLFLATILGAPSPYRHEAPTLVGVTVQTKVAGTRYTVPNPAAAQSGTLSKTEYVVVKEEKGFLWVREGKLIVQVERALLLTPKEAIEYFTNLLAQSPQSTSPYMRRSKAHELLRDYDAAIKDYDELIKLAPTVSAYWNNRGNIWSRKKEYDKAIADYEKAIPLSTTPYISIGNLGNMHLNRREWDKAIEVYTKAIQSNPSYARSYASRSGAWREKRDYQKALEDAQEAVKLDETSPYAFGSRGMVRLLLKEYDNALSDLNTAIELDGSLASSYLYRGMVHAQRKEYQPAIRDYDTAIRLFQDYSAAHVKRAEAWLVCGNSQLAFSDATIAANADKNYPAGYRTLAWVLACAKDANIRNGTKALESARKAIEFAKSEDGYYQEAIAAAYAELGQFDTAIVHQKKAIADTVYVKQAGEAVQQRLALYEAKKPYRE